MFERITDVIASMAMFSINYIDITEENYLDIIYIINNNISPTFEDWNYYLDGRVRERRLDNIIND